MAEPMITPVPSRSTPVYIPPPVVPIVTAQRPPPPDVLAKYTQDGKAYDIGKAVQEGVKPEVLKQSGFSDTQIQQAQQWAAANPLPPPPIASNPQAAETLRKVAEIETKIHPLYMESINLGARTDKLDDLIAVNKRLVPMLDERVRLLSSIGISEQMFDQVQNQYLAATVGGGKQTQPLPFAWQPSGGLTPEQVDKFANITREELLKLNPALAVSREATQAEYTEGKFLAAKTEAYKESEAKAIAEAKQIIARRLAEDKAKGVPLADTLEQLKREGLTQGGLVAQVITERTPWGVEIRVGERAVDPNTGAEYIGGQGLTGKFFPTVEVVNKQAEQSKAESEKTLTNEPEHYVRGVIGKDGMVTFTDKGGELVRVSADSYQKYENWLSQTQSRNAARQYLIDNKLGYLGGDNLFNADLEKAIKTEVPIAILLNAGYTQKQIDDAKAKAEAPTPVSAPIIPPTPMTESGRQWQDVRTSKVYSDAEYKALVKDYEAKRDNLIQQGKMYSEEWNKLGGHPANYFRQTRESALTTIEELPARVIGGVQEKVAGELPKMAVPDEVLNKPLSVVVPYLNKKSTIELMQSGEGLSGDEAIVLADAIRKVGLPLKDGSGVVTWRELSEQDKAKVAELFAGDTRPPVLSYTARTAASAAITVPTYAVLGLPALLATIAKKPQDIGGTLLETVKGIVQSGVNTFWVAPKSMLAGTPMSPEQLGTDIGVLVLVAEPTIKGVSGVIKGGIARIDPRAVTGESLALTVDVGRVQIPEGMAKLAARQLVEDVITQQINGEIPASRLRSLEGVKAVDKVEVKNEPTGTTDIVLKSADGNVVGHISGTQRVLADAIYHASPNIEGIVDQIREKGYLEVEVPPEAKSGMFFSPQLAQGFAFDEKGTPSPGFLGLRVDKVYPPPRDVLDSPTLSIMREKMQAKAEKGELDKVVYVLYKGYKGADGASRLEYELYIPNGTKLYPVQPTWYAKGDIPQTDVTSMVSYSGEGKPVGYGDRLPMYWLATDKALAEGKGVPSLSQIYAAKLWGDLTTLREYSPWNLRIRPSESVETTGATSPNPFVSSYQQVKLSAVPTDTSAGRMSAIIRNDKGEILLTRTLGQNRYDLPGGEAVFAEVSKGVRMAERPEVAVAREVYEETGLTPSYVEHIATIESKFNPTDNPRKFQVFDVEARGKVAQGTEIAEYRWWDGKSQLDYPVAEFAKDALSRKLTRDTAIDAETVVKTIDEINKKVDSEIAKNPKLDRDSLLQEEFARIDKDLEAKRIPRYKPEGRPISDALFTPLPERSSVVSPDEKVEKVSNKLDAVVDDKIKDKLTFGVMLYPVEKVGESEKRIPSDIIGGIPEKPPKTPPEKVIIPERPLEFPPEKGTPERPPTVEVPPEPPPEKTPEQPPEKPPPESPPEKPPPEPPPEKPPEKPPLGSPPPPPPPIRKVSISDAGKKAMVELSKPGTLEWRQGVKWIATAPPYTTQYYLDNPLPGTYKFATGKGSAARTLQVLNGPLTKDVDIALGWADVHVDTQGNITFAGGQEAANTRWAMEEAAAQEARQQEIAQGRMPISNQQMITEQDRLIQPSERLLTNVPPSENVGDKTNQTPQLQVNTLSRVDRLPDLHKVELRQYRTGKLKVYSVNSTFIRDNLDLFSGGEDFTMGGHHYVFDWIPENEVWIADNINDYIDKKATILHEITELNKMRDGMEYNQAHENYANVMEEKGRHNPRELDSLIDSELNNFEDVEQIPESSEPIKVVNEVVPRKPKQTSNQDEESVEVPARFKKARRSVGVSYGRNTYLGREVLPSELGVSI